MSLNKYNANIEEINVNYQYFRFSLIVKIFNIIKNLIKLDL